MLGIFAEKSHEDLSDTKTIQAIASIAEGFPPCGKKSSRRDSKKMERDDTLPGRVRGGRFGETLRHFRRKSFSHAPRKSI